MPIEILHWSQRALRYCNLWCFGWELSIAVPHYIFAVEQIKVPITSCKIINLPQSIKSGIRWLHCDGLRTQRLCHILLNLMIRHRPQIERMESHWDLEGLNESPVISQRRRPEMWAKGGRDASPHERLRNLSHSLRLKALDRRDVCCRTGSFAFLPVWYSGNITRALMGRQLSWDVASWS